MAGKYIFSNLIGCFVFDEEFKVVEKSKDEKSIVKKYSDAEIINKDSKNLNKALDFFKDKKYFSEFYEKNLLLTKRALKEAVNDDLLIVQTVSNIEELDRTANTLIKRLREWYELYNPEFSKSVSNNESFVKLILEKDKEQLLKELKLKKEDSMGADFKAEDLKPIMELAERVSELYVLRSSQEEYLKKLMQRYCPNLTAIVGHMIGAKLLLQAGSLKHLVGFPASTIQLLGAEKALFRHLRTGAKSPKHGVIIQHPLVAKAKNKGKAARVLADKIGIAVKVDYFKGEFIGDKLKKDVEDKLK